MLLLQHLQLQIVRVEEAVAVLTQRDQQIRDHVLEELHGHRGVSPAPDEHLTASQQHATHHTTQATTNSKRNTGGMEIEDSGYASQRESNSAHNEATLHSETTIIIPHWD